MKYRKRLIAIFIIFIILLSTVSPLSVFGKKNKKKPKKLAKEINIFMNYADSTIFGTDYIMEGLDWDLQDTDHNVLATGTTDNTGMITYAIKGSYDNNGYGIHLDYIWQGNSLRLMNLEAGDYEIELGLFDISSDIFWADDLSPAQLGEVEIWFDGVNIVNVTLIGVDLNQLVLAELIAGDFTIKADLISDKTITVSTTGYTYNSDILVSAEGFLISRILGFLKGNFLYSYIFFSFRKIVSQVKSFPLFLSTLLYNETKTSYRLFHYSLDFCLLDFTLKAIYK